MRDFFKTKFFAAIVIAALVLTIVPTVFSAMGLGQYVKDGVNTVFTPVQKLFTYATNAISGFTDYFTEFDRIVEENNQLRGQVAELEDQIYSAEEQKQMNDWLCEYLELKREHADYVFETAAVTGRESGNYMTVFTLDRGTSHSVTAGMPVITSAGIVGYITEAGRDWSKAVTILESGTAIGVYVERTGEVAVAQGDYSLAGQNLCRLSYLTKDSDIEAGDRILSSGYGSVYPRGLVVGYVSSVEKDPNSQSLVAYVTPAAEMQDLSNLMIITDYETYTE